MKQLPRNQPMQPLAKTRVFLDHQPAHFEEEPVSLCHTVQLVLMLFQEVNVTFFRNKLQELNKGKHTGGHEVHAQFFRSKWVIYLLESTTFSACTCSDPKAPMK